MLNNAMSVVILAAGKGTRMYSDLPKVLHTLAGKAMVQHVIDAANELGAAHVHLVYGHGGDLLKQALKDDNLNWVLQAEQLGTGHAMQQAAPFFADDEDILMLYGDVPADKAKSLLWGFGVFAGVFGIAALILALIKALGSGSLLICAAIAAILALAVVGALKGQLKQAAQQSTAHSYIRDGSFCLDVNADHFLYESTSKRKIEDNAQKE